MAVLSNSLRSICRFDSSKWGLF